METITEAKQFLRENWEVGIECPCCNQLVKLYKRPFNSGMAYSLILIYKMTEEGKEWIHVQNEFAERFGMNANRMDYSQLKRWGLVAEQYGERDDGSNRVGFWKITDKGRRFVLGLETIPKRVHLFNNKVFGYSGEQVTIKDALGSKFDYRELMGSHYLEPKGQDSLF